MSSRVFTVLLFLLFALSVKGQLPASYYYTNVLTGSATVYDDWQSLGGCGYLYNPAPGYQIFTTVGTSEVSFGNGQLCGMCLEVTSITEESNQASQFPNPPYIVMLTNDGPVPTDNWLDHSFTYPVSGLWQATYTAVPCPVSGMPIQWQLNAGSSVWYVQIVPTYHTLALAQMCILDVNGNWQEMTLMNGIWYYPAEMPATLTVKAISVDGQIVQDTINANLANSIQQTQIFSGQTPGNFGPINYGNLAPAINCNAGPWINTAPTKEQEAHEEELEKEVHEEQVAEHAPKQQEQQVEQQNQQEQQVEQQNQREQQQQQLEDQLGHGDTQQNDQSNVKANPGRKMGPAAVMSILAVVASVLVVIGAAFIVVKRRNARAYDALLTSEVNANDEHSSF